MTSGDRSFERDENSFDPTRPDPALHVDRRDRLQLPAVPGLVVEGLLQLVAGHLPAEQTLTNLDDLVLVSHRASVYCLPDPPTGPTASCSAPPITGPRTTATGPSRSSPPEPSPSTTKTRPAQLPHPDSASARTAV